MKSFKAKSALWVAAVLMTGAVGSHAKIPAPTLTPEAKAKAAEATAKTAWQNKVADYQLCVSQDRVAAHYRARAAASAVAAAAPAVPVTIPPCADPGPFVYVAPDAKPLEAAGAHSPVATASQPPNTKATANEVKTGTPPAPSKPTGK